MRGDNAKSAQEQDSISLCFSLEFIEIKILHDAFLADRQITYCRLIYMLIHLKIFSSTSFQIIFEGNTTYY